MSGPCARNIDLVGDTEVIGPIRDLARRMGLAVTDPEPTECPRNPADAPFGAETLFGLCERIRLVEVPENGLDAFLRQVRALLDDFETSIAPPPEVLLRDGPTELAIGGKERAPAND